MTDLETQLHRLQAENDHLAEAVVDHGRLALDDTQVPQPALT